MVKTHTLNRVEHIRKSLGFSPGEMADLLGVNITTLYRWESAGVKPSMDPLQNKLLEYIQYRLDGDTTKDADVSAWAERLKSRLAIGGTLQGLAFLLHPLVESA